MNRIFQRYLTVAIALAGIGYVRSEAQGPTQWQSFIQPGLPNCTIQVGIALPDFEMTVLEQPSLAETNQVRIHTGPGSDRLVRGPVRNPLCVGDGIELGDGPEVGGTAVAVTFPFVVEGKMPVLWISWRVAMPNPGHKAFDPSAQVVVTIEGLEDACGTKRITSVRERDGWEPFEADGKKKLRLLNGYLAGGDIVYSKAEFEDLVVDLSVYPRGSAGSVKVIGSDCCHLGHPAVLVAMIQSTHNLELERQGDLVCPGDEMRLRVPQGARNIRWHTGELTESIATKGGPVSVTFNLGNSECPLTLRDTIPVPAPGPDITLSVCRDTICLGDSTCVWGSPIDLLADSTATDHYDFGDGTFSPNAGSKKYAAAGVFVITRTVTFNSGCTKRATQLVVVVEQKPALRIETDCESKPTRWRVFVEGVGATRLRSDWSVVDSTAAPVSIELLSEDEVRLTPADGMSYTFEFTMVDKYCGDTTLRLTVVKPPEPLPMAKFLYVGFDTTTKAIEYGVDTRGSRFTVSVTVEILDQGATFLREEEGIWYFSFAKAGPYRVVTRGIGEELTCAVDKQQMTLITAPHWARISRIWNPPPVEKPFKPGKR